MPNSIPVQQNSERSLSCLRASGFLYDRAKRTHLISLLLTLPIPIVVSTLAVLFPGFRPFAAVVGLAISFLDTAVLDEVQKKSKKLAAKIQELFDCELFGMNWNGFRAGEMVPWETIHKFAEKYKRKWRPLNKDNWYSPSVGSVDFVVARLICQRTNILWDSGARGIYLIILSVAGAVLFIASIIVGMSLSMALSDYVLSLLVPLFPALLWIVKEGKKQWESMDTLNRLKGRVSELWETVKSGSYSETQLQLSTRELQDEIFSHRCSNQPVFNLVHRVIKRQMEEQMDVGAEDLVRQINN